MACPGPSLYALHPSAIVCLPSCETNRVVLRVRPVTGPRREIWKFGDVPITSATDTSPFYDPTKVGVVSHDCQALQYVPKQKVCER